MTTVDWVKVSDIAEDAIPGTPIQVANVAARLCFLVRESFAINAVPIEVFELLIEVSDAANSLEDLIGQLGDEMVAQLPAPKDEEQAKEAPVLEGSEHRPASRKWKGEA